MFNKIIEVNLVENNGDLYLRSHGIWKIINIFINFDIF